MNKVVKAIVSVLIVSIVVPTFIYALIYEIELLGDIVVSVLILFFVAFLSLVLYAAIE